MKDILDNLLDLLLNKSFDEGSRDDIAMDLSDNDTAKTFIPLLVVAQDENDSGIVRNSCMESLAQILYRNKENKLYLDRIEILKLMQCLELIKKNRLDLYNEFELSKLE